MHHVPAGHTLRLTKGGGRVLCDQMGRPLSRPSQRPEKRSGDNGDVSSKARFSQTGNTADSGNTRSEDDYWTVFPDPDLCADLEQSEDDYWLPSRTEDSPTDRCTRTGNSRNVHLQSEERIESSGCPVFDLECCPLDTSKDSVETTAEHVDICAFAPWENTNFHQNPHIHSGCEKGRIGENGVEPCPRCDGELHPHPDLAHHFVCDDCGHVLYSDLGPNLEQGAGLFKDAEEVSLPEQIRRLELTLAEGPDLLCDFIRDHWPSIRDMARVRLIEGFEAYGSTMYGWDATVRLRNVLEEFADAPVYMSSERGRE